MNEEHERSALRARIAHARGHRTSRRRTLLRILAGVALLGVVGGGGVWIGSRLDRETPRAPALAEPPAPAAAETPAAAPARAGAPPADPAPEPAPSPERPSTERPSTQAPEVPAPVSDGAGRPPVPSVPEPAHGGGRASVPAPGTSSAGEAAESAARASAAGTQVRFEEMLGRLDHMLRSTSSGASPAPGDEAVRQRIGLRRDKALEAHRDGDADSALRLLDEAMRDAEELIRAGEARFRLALQAARDAYAAGNAAQARIHISQARRQRPADPEAKHWEARIAKLPELLAARREAEDARVAGRLREERAALRRVIEIDPDDTGAGERVAAIDREIRARAFARAIAQGRRAVEDRALEPARQALAEARRRDPQHPDTRRLHSRVAALDRTLSRDRHLAAAERAAGRDDWEAALGAFEEARAIEPTHDAAVSGSRLAARIVNAQRAVDELLSRPERLGSSRVAGAARDALDRAATLTALSARLASGAEGLERALEAARTPVPVRIVSDEETEIGIRGVGIVGRVRERTIELPPGEYVFEGKRRGYRSRLVEVMVRADPGTPVEVRVVCDERS